ncbi:formate dehydrogenase accessory protein FdhE [Infirmifilum sp.]
MYSTLAIKRRDIMEENILIAKAREIYKDIPIDPSSLETYVKLMALQETLQRRFYGKYTELDTEKIKEVLSQNKPAFLAVDLGLDETELGETLKSISSLLKSELPDVSKSLEIIEKAWEDKQLSMVEIGESLLHGNTGVLHAKADELGVDHEILEAVSAWVLQVLFQALSKELSQQVDFSSWSIGKCPVCGGYTRLEYLDEKGNAHLKCQFCGTEWGYPAGKCPYCGNDDKEKITVVGMDKEKRFTLNICNNCGMYWKVVDEQVVGQEIPRRLYDLWTFRLDIVASGAKG